MDRCYICGNPRVQIHHIFHGRTGVRKSADADGFIVPLCREHHTGNDGVHFRPELDRALKQKAQIVWERFMGRSREEFIKRYGRNYL